ncbi:hypothetical protein [Halococcus salifodinae]|uniref:Uncharacterized protein n=1 Tax=Halococcus salifodinae DSM 8989 TaxID=1227456 RepID=M0MTD4_9EURY|nr:hypothetical protein [Halococcus salifodinae]EMA48593.1 hypothetical protein C450_19296 [Halococcus salifodinae DSM 8989]
MEFERGSPFSLRDQVCDLRSEASQHGLLRGYPRWVWGQGSRIDEIAEASRADERDDLRAQHEDRGWYWRLLEGWFHHFNSGPLADLAVFVGFVWFYLRFFFIVTYLTVFLMIAPLAALYAVAAAVNLSLSGAITGGGYAVLAYWVVRWLRSGAVESRPSA